MSKKFHITQLCWEPVIDVGEVATIDKISQNNTPVTLPKSLGEVMHVDIGYVCKTEL